MFVSSPEYWTKWNKNIANRSFANEMKLKYFKRTLRNLNWIQKNNKNILKSANVYYHSVQKLLFFLLQYKNVRNKMYRSIILPIVLVWQWHLVHDNTQGKKTEWEYWKTKWWGEYLKLSARKWEVTEENCTRYALMRILRVSRPYSWGFCSSGMWESVSV